MSVVNWREVFRWLLAGFFLCAGANHFRAPEFYRLMMPPWLPAPVPLIYISGMAEMLGGIGVLMPVTRRLAGWGLMFLLIAVFPANLHMALSGVRGLAVPGWLAWARLPLQAGFLVWVWWVAVAPEREATLD